MQSIRQITWEHSVLERKLRRLEKFCEGVFDRKIIISVFDDFESFWNEHERKEEEFFGKLDEKDIPFRKTIISQHRDLRGHWKIIKDYLKGKDDFSLGVALNTDGKMMIDKFRKHMRLEEDYFKEAGAQVYK